MNINKILETVYLEDYAVTAMVFEGYVTILNWGVQCHFERFIALVEQYAPGWIQRYQRIQDNKEELSKPGVVYLRCELTDAISAYKALTEYARKNYPQYSFPDIEYKAENHES